MNGYTYYYVLEIKGIQDFIFQGGQLKLAIGGSELVEQLPKKILPEILQKLDLVEEEDFEFLSQNAGGARLLFKEQDVAENLLRIIPLAIGMHAPGLAFVQAAVRLENSLSATMAQAGEILQQQRNFIFPELPVAGPLADRFGRSGLPAVDKEEGKPVDASFRARMESSSSNSLLAKVFPGKQFKMATLVEEIAEENEYLAILHADGNGLGSLVRGFLEDLNKVENTIEAAERYKQFSMSIEEAAVAALRDALNTIVEKVPEGGTMPFRLLICAGDDVTLLLNARDALEVAEKFLSTFETETANRLAASLQKAHLTASAGVVFTHRKYPYAHAYELCESLTSFAKDATNREVSAIAFHRITAGTASDYEVILDREMRTADGILLTQGPYVIGEKSETGHSHFDQLCALKLAIEAMPRGLRGLLDAIWSDRERAEQAFRRIQTIAERENEESFSNLKRALKELTGAAAGESIFLRKCDHSGLLSTPLYDALELSAATRKSGANKSTSATGHG